MADAEGANVIKQEAFTPKVRWCTPKCLDVMTFVGHHVFAIAHDIYIIFFNYKTNTETVYLANHKANGDGVDALAGHRSQIFAYAEKVLNPRIFIVMYPSFARLAEIKETDTKRYKSLVMMEGDLIAGFTGFPNYLLTVWCWRTNQRLYRVETGVKRRKQMYLASRTHMLICQCWGDGLNVWEVARCYKKCFVLKRPRMETTGWEITEPMLTGACWGLEGTLYVIDPKANLFSMSSDGIGLNKELEWSDETIEGKRHTSLCSFLSGLLIYGPDEKLRYLKKKPESKAWKVEWSFVPNDVVARLVSNSVCDMATMWTEAGFVYMITADSEEKIEVNLFTIKPRNIMKIQLIAPDFKYIALMNTTAVLSIYDVENQHLVLMKQVIGFDVSFAASPVEPVLAVFGEVESGNYGVTLYSFNPDETDLMRHDRMSLTHQIVSLVAFAPDGRYMVAASIAAGHIFVFKVSADFKLTLVRYMEVGRGLADCFLMMVGKDMRCFSLVLFSEKYSIGERIICINADTGKDNKFAGKMQGPYTRLLPLSSKDTILAIPHLSKQMHILKLSGDKGTTVSVKMGPIIDSGHEIKQFDAFRTDHALLTFSFDGTVILRQPTCPENYELKIFLTHRYENGIKSALVGGNNRYIVHIGANGTVACVYLHESDYPSENLEHHTPDNALFEMVPEAKINAITVIHRNDKNYLQLQEDKKVQEETTYYKRQREDVCRTFANLQKKLIELLEENINERPLHQLSLSEFNLHQEAKKERLRAAEKEREEIRLHTEARIHAQDKVTEWIKKTCWDTMKSPRIKLFAIHSHYHVENFATLPTQRDTWPELQQIEALRSIEMENDSDLFRPWLDEPLEDPFKNSSEINPMSRSSGSRSRAPSVVSFRDLRRASMIANVVDEESVETTVMQPYVLSGSSAHNYVTIPKCMIPQMEAYSFLQMNWLYELVKLTNQNMRAWFNKQFDELFVLKKREVGLVSERNDRLRFIIEEINKLSDLRGSFHHLNIVISDPTWRQEEHVQKLVKVEPEECEIEPYISPSQIVIIPPDPGPKDDFRERALMEMMDGVLEKLWHEEIKKPIPMPQCMLEKDPEQFNEDDLRQVFEYEAKVRFRNEERDRYRKMLHAEYAKLSQVLNEGIVKFNQKVRETWLLKIKADSIIGQENLNLMRLRRANLDRIEKAELLEEMRNDIAVYERQVEELNAQFAEIQGQNVECQAAYDVLTAKDRHMEKTFKNHFGDMPPIVIEQGYKVFKKRPKWHQRASMIPVVLAELAQAVATGVRPPLLHPDVLDYFKGIEVLDHISNMPAVLDEHLWATTCRLRRAKIENEIRMRALVQDLAYVDHASGVWSKGIQIRLTYLATVQANVQKHREVVELEARNKTVQLVLPAGQVEIVTTGHMQDFEDAALIPRVDIEKINNLIMKVGEMKLRMMRKQMEFRKGILSKEWEHSQMKMKLRHMKMELESYKRLRIPKELQRYLKNKELGYTDEQDFIVMEKENEASKAGVEKVLNHQMNICSELELKIMRIEAERTKIENLIIALNVKVSDKKLNEDALEPIRIRRVFKRRMETLVTRSRLIREVQANHSTIIMLQTELELLRLKTFPTLASFCTY